MSKVVSFHSYLQILCIALSPTSLGRVPGLESRCCDDSNLMRRLNLRSNTSMATNQAVACVVVHAEDACFSLVSSLLPFY